MARSGWHRSENCSTGRQAPSSHRPPCPQRNCVNCPFFSPPHPHPPPPATVVRRRHCHRSTSTVKKRARPKLPPLSTARTTTVLPHHYQNTMFQREADVAKWRQKNDISRVDRVLRDTRFLPHLSIGTSLCIRRRRFMRP